MPLDLKKLRDEYATLHGEAGSVIEKAEKDGKFSDEDKAANDKRFERMQAINMLLDEEKRFAGLAITGTEDDKKKNKVVLPTEPPGRREFEAAQREQQEEQFDADAYREALNKFARTGELGPELQFTVSTATGSGAYLPKQVLPPTTVRRLQNAWRGILAAYNMQAIETTSMAAFSLPVADDTANNGQAQSETATSGTEQDPTDASISIVPNLYSSKQFWYSNTMVMAGGFDVQTYTLPMAQKRLDKIQESAWTTKVVSNATVGKTTAATNAITYAELLDWEHSLPAQYRSDAGFVVSDSLLRGLRGLVDDQHRPIFDVDPTGTFQGRIHGKPVIVSDQFDTLAAGHKPGAFVSAEALKIVDILNARLARYFNVPSKPDQVGFELFQNGDFGFITNGVRLLATAAS